MRCENKKRSGKLPKDVLRGRKFSNDNDAMSAVNKWVQEVGEHFFHDTLEMLKYHWDKCIRIKEDMSKNNVIVEKMFY